MSMHPHSSALLHELQRATEADRQLAAQSRLLRGDSPPQPQAGALRARMSAAMVWLGDRWRNRVRTPRTRQTVEPTGS